MKLQYICLILNLLLSAYKLLGQTNSTRQPAIMFLDAASQSNIVVIVDGQEHSQPCPLKYTNLISNTNLFTPTELSMLKEIPLKYKNITTNSGPPGSVLVGLDKTNGDWDWVARLQYTNTDAHEDIMLGARGLLAKFRTASDEGYDVTIYNYKTSATGISDIDFEQIRHGATDALVVTMHGDHCTWLMHFADGKAIGKWFVWGQESYEAGKLIIEAEFKQPYDYKTHALPMNSD